MRLPTIEDVRAAAARIAPYAQRTPLIENAVLNDRLGARLLLKCETLQRIGAFKFRGAYNRIAQVDRAVHPGGVVACSSGNHAMGVAEAARLTGLKAAIVMPRDAPAVKIERTRRLGAEVVLYDRERESREEIAAALGRERRADFVAPYDDPDVIAGQGTVGLEIMQQTVAIGASPDLVLAPCSGGGLGTGIALAVKAARPDCRVMLAEPEGFDDYGRSLASGRRERNARLSGSICDALLAPTPGELTFALAQKLIASGTVASDGEVRAAIRFAFEELRLVVEPGGAAALAAVLAGRVPVAGQTAVVVLSGGNVDPALFAAIVTAQ